MPKTNASTTSLTGSLIIGTGTAASSVGIGGGVVWAGGKVVSDSFMDVTSNANAGFRFAPRDTGTPLSTWYATGGNTILDITGGPSTTVSIAHATGAWTFPKPVIIPSTNTAGLQLYNTADQTTNYERLDEVWSGNVALIQSTAAGSATFRDLTLRTNGRASLTFKGGTIGNTGGMVQFSNTTTSVAGNIGWLFSGGNTATSGTNIGLSLTPTYNQASGTAANTDFLVNRTQTAVGSGAQLLADFQVGGTSQVSIDNGGRIDFKAGTSSAVGLRFGADTLVYRRTGGQLSLESGATNTSFMLAKSNAALDEKSWDILINATQFKGRAINDANNAANEWLTVTRSSTSISSIVFATGTTTTALTLGSAQQATFAGALITTPQLLSGAGAVNTTTSSTEYTSTGAAQALTLANGTVGQRKTIVHTVDGGSGLLTPTTAIGFSTVTFTNVGDSVDLIYTTTGWAVIGSRGAVIA